MNIKLTHSATARVTLHLEIDVDSTWGADCSIQQVHAQAVDGARGAIRNLLDKNPDQRRRMRVVGDPIISAVIVEGKP